MVSPNSWASDITLSQLSAEPFFGDMSSLTSSTNISAPPPGKPCIPASASFRRTSEVSKPHTSAIPSISIGEKQSSEIIG